MKNILPDNDVASSNGRETTRKTRWPRPAHCSICDNAVWFRPITLKEPIGVPEPRRSWVLCNHCHHLLLIEMRRSPVRSPLRLRIALGLVASERSPQAYGTTTHARDKRLFVFIAWVLITAMLLHLALIVVLVSVTR